MIQPIPIEITLGSFSVIGILTGYIWNAQNKKIERIYKIQASRPCHFIAKEIAQIKTDLRWIKKNLKE